ncbi:aminotransferase class V-fold PLP-dependent enzyme [Candidatus Latescibacterota bacterium]
MMSKFFETLASSVKERLSRRDLFKSTGLAALAGLAGCGKIRGPEAHKDRIPIPTVQSIGVKPIINCWGTFTHHSGNLLEPEVKKAMMKATEQFVLMDELGEAVGRRLGELTGAEWGIVTSGAAAALTAATCACIVGTDPEKMLLLPYIEDLKNEVVCKGFGTYTRAVWMVGVKMIVVKTREEMEAAVNEKTAMMFGNSDDIIAVGKKYGIPILCDAAAEEPSVPNYHLQNGCDLVAYSGGKVLNGPQSSGLLIGRKDLCKAAWLNMAPHHAYGRPMKIDKEAIMGLLTAVDLWFNGRDHDAEWNEWEYRLDYIVKHISDVPTLKTHIEHNLPRGLGNKQPILTITWDEESLKLTYEEAQKQLLNQDPRISVMVSGGGLVIRPYQTQKDDEIRIASGFKKLFASVI